VYGAATWFLTFNDKFFNHLDHNASIFQQFYVSMVCMFQRFVCFNCTYDSKVSMFQWFVCFNGLYVSTVCMFQHFLCFNVTVQMYSDMSVTQNIVFFHVST
jgi:hypothetical protein